MDSDKRYEGVAALACAVAVCLLFVLVAQGAYYARLDGGETLASRQCAAGLRDYAREGRTGHGANGARAEQFGISQAHHDWCDLAAQESMARSTVGMESAAWLGLGVSAVGLVLLFFTALYARTAAQAATGSLVEARRTAEASADAAKASADAAEATARAFDLERGLVFVTPVIVTTGDVETGFRFEGRCELKNHGRSPVVLRELEYGFEIQDREEDPPTGFGRDETWLVPDTVLVPGDARPSIARTSQRFNREDWEMLSSGHMKIWFLARLIYEDVAGVGRRTTVRLLYRPSVEMFHPNGGPPHNQRA